MTKKRTPIDLILDAVEWKALATGEPSDDGIPVATHEGILRIGNAELKVYQLSNGVRVIEEQSLVRFFSGQQ